MFLKEDFKKNIALFITNLGKIWLTPPAAKTFFLSLLIIFLQLLLIVFLLPMLPPEVPLFYSRHWGEEMLTNPVSLFIIPVLSSLFLIINAAVASFFSGSKTFITSLLFIIAFINSFLFLITLVEILIISL